MLAEPEARNRRSKNIKTGGYGTNLPSDGGGGPGRHLLSVANNTAGFMSANSLEVSGVEPALHRKGVS